MVTDKRTGTVRDRMVDVRSTIWPENTQLIRFHAYNRHRPDHFFVIKHAHNMSISGLNIQNWPTHCFYINGAQDLTMEDIVLDNSAGDAPNELSGDLPAAHNADGFDVSSSDHVTLKNVRVHNQDDCVAVRLLLSLASARKCTAPTNAV